MIRGKKKKAFSLKRERHYPCLGVFTEVSNPREKEPKPVNLGEHVFSSSWGSTEKNILAVRSKTPWNEL